MKKNFYGIIKMKVYYGKAIYNQKEIQASLKVLKDKSLTLIDGPAVKELEGKRCEYLNPKKYNNALIFGGVALTAAAIGVGYYLLKEK